MVSPGSLVQCLGVFKTHWKHFSCRWGVQNLVSFSRTMLIVGFQKRRLTLSLFSCHAPQDYCLGVLINRTYCPTYAFPVSQLSKKASNHMMALGVLKELRGVTILKSLLDHTSFCAYFCIVLSLPQELFNFIKNTLPSRIAPNYHTHSVVLYIQGGNFSKSPLSRSQKPQTNSMYLPFVSLNANTWHV